LTDPFESDPDPKRWVVVVVVGSLLAGHLVSTVFDPLFSIYPSIGMDKSKTQRLLAMYNMFRISQKGVAFFPAYFKLFY
jgi:hypothetical protein